MISEHRPAKEVEVVGGRAALGGADRVHRQYVYLAGPAAQDGQHSRGRVAAAAIECLGHAVARASRHDGQRDGSARAHDAVEALVQHAVAAHRNDAVK